MARNTYERLFALTHLMKRFRKPFYMNCEVRLYLNTAAFKYSFVEILISIEFCLNYLSDLTGLN